MTLEELEKFEKRRKKLSLYLFSNLVRLDKSFPLIISTVKSFKVQSNLFPPIISATPPKKLFYGRIKLEKLRYRTPIS